MSSRLDSKPQIHTLAADLGLKHSASPCQRILHTVETRVKAVSKKFGCTSLNDLLIAVANDVGTVLREIRSEADLRALRDEYVAKGELIFANIEKELERPDDYGITIGLHHNRAWEPRFVSVIDCRGNKNFKSYFTKWHELAHLLTLTQQMRLVFRRSHSRENSDDPEEKLMDVIAGAMGFLPDFLSDGIGGDVSFEGISSIRMEFCPDASVQAATIGIVNAFPKPCILIDAQMALKKGQVAALTQTTFGFRKGPIPTLRAVHVTVNTAAREAGLQFFRNWRVPPQSVIAKVFENGEYAEAYESLDLWRASGGKRLAAMPVLVKAKRIGESVQALITPTDF